MAKIDLTKEEIEHLKHLLREIDWCIKDDVYNGLCEHYKSVKDKLWKE